MNSFLKKVSRNDRFLKGVKAAMRRGRKIVISDPQKGKILTTVHTEM